jgi:hypothetical protein
MDRLPNLFIVGAPRCGTSAMFGLLAQHPDISVSNPKETFYFCADFHEESDRYAGSGMRFPIRTESAYLSLFADRSRTFVAEATPVYLCSRAAPARIRAFNPDAMIVVLVRDPIVMLQSLHAKLVSRGFEDLHDFREAMDAEPERRAGRRLPVGLFWPTSLYYSEWVRFSEQIERYREAFPGRVRVVVYDDFRRDNQAVVNDVAVGFLGLSPFAPLSREFNGNRSSRFPALSRAVAKLGDVRVRKLVPFQVRHRLLKIVAKGNSKRVRRPPLDPAFRRELVARFRPEVERLDRLLQRDLVTTWGNDHQGL